MLSTYLIIITLAFLSGLTTLIGVALAICCKQNIKMVVAGIGFSTGIMLLISFFELIPESLSMIGIPKTLMAVFLGIIITAILNFIIPHTHLIQEKKKSSLLKIAYLIAFGLILHDFPEGFAMANSYLVAPSLGLLIALAIAIHNIPEEFAMAVPVILAGEKKILFRIAFLSGLAEPAGAIIGLSAVHLIPLLNPYLIAFAAGAMIFIALHELLPMASRYKNVFLFILGIILSGLVYSGLTVLLPS